MNFRRKPFQSTQKTTQDVDNGHSKECRSFDVHPHCNTVNTFKIRLRRCRRDRTGTRSCQTRTPSIFFFVGPRKRGVRPHPPNPPWLRAWTHLLMTVICHEIVDSENQAASVEHSFLFLVIPSISLEGGVTIIGS